MFASTVTKAFKDKTFKLLVLKRFTWIKDYMD